jgi:HAMP domain-containing protein
MRLVICPGVHEPKLTDCFLTGLSGLWGLAADRQNQQIVEPVKIFPAHKYPPFSALDVWQFLCSEELAGESLVFVSFSAGVAGAIGAALAVAATRRQSRGIFCLRRLGSTSGGQFSHPPNQPRSLYALEFGNSRWRWRKLLCRSGDRTFGFMASSPNGKRLARQPNRRRH